MRWLAKVNDRQVNHVSKAPVSVLIPTRNEERNLPACLASLDWADEIVVYDSGSTDGTLDVAAEYGVGLVEREFDDFAAHKNWALDNIDFRNDWILLIDADERVTEALANEIRSAVARADGVPGYHIARQTMFGGVWIRHGGVYPDFNLRLLRQGSGRYEDRLVHEHILLDGRAGYLKNPLLHDDDKGMTRFLERHNHYTSLEAVEILRARRGVGGDRLQGALWRRGPQRRRWLKNLAQRWLPFRPFFVFLYMYVWKAGLLDGRAGFHYCFLKMVFEHQISLKVRELGNPRSPLYQRYRAYLE